ncbi:MAG: hypothetical protein ACOY45_00840 [Pseudomonadota bacterium]
MAAAAAWAGLLATGAHAATLAQDKCVAPGDATGLIQAILPGMLKGMANTCRETLPPGAFILNQPAAFTAKYDAAAQAAAPQAVAAINVISGDQAVGVPPEMIMPMVQGMAEPLLGGLIKPEDCVGANRIVELLAPLPAENLANLFVTILQMRSAAHKDEELPVCPMEQ